MVTPATPAIFFESLACRSDSARALTCARYGLITTVDGAGRTRQGRVSRMTWARRRVLGTLAASLAAWRARAGYEP